MKSVHHQARLGFLLIICIYDRNREKKAEGRQEGRDPRQRELNEPKSGVIAEDVVCICVPASWSRLSQLISDNVMESNMVRR